MNSDYLNNIKLMRYDFISPVLTKSTDDTRSIIEIIRESAEKGAIDRNDGIRKYFAAPTVLRWYRNFLKGGLEGLEPKTRCDKTTFHKIDDDIYAKILELKKQFPRITSTSIRKKLIALGVIAPSQVSLSTVNRCVNKIKASLAQTPIQKEEMRRYERAHINEVWCGDSSVGPYIKINGIKHKLYIQALIDDASRFIVGIDIFLNDTFENFMKVMKSAVAKYGVPKLFNFDNGSCYKNKQMEMLIARMGSSVHYDRPYTPTQKAKIERFYRTLKDQWLADLDYSKFHSVDEVRNSLFNYVQKYNTNIHSSLKGKTPQNRFFEESILITRLASEKIDNIFMYKIERKVSFDGVVAINNQQFEVDYRFSRKTITIRYTPDLQNYFVEDTDGSLIPIKVLNKVENSKKKRQYYFSENLNQDTNSYNENANGNTENANGNTANTYLNLANGTNTNVNETNANETNANEPI